jgi:hypothetical protein
MANLMPRPEVSQRRKDNPMGRVVARVRTACQDPG